MEVGGSRDRDAPRRPILEEVPAAAAERTAHAAQVMAADPVCFAPLVTVGDAYLASYEARRHAAARRRWWG